MGDGRALGERGPDGELSGRRAGRTIADRWSSERQDRRVETEPLSFTCPRCSQPAEAATYGPCPACRSELRARFQSEGADIEVARYEPKMNVVPNQVATKD